jgi:hypothetical protein
METSKLKQQNKVDDKIVAESNYKGQLPSQKYFTPQELSNLSRVGKQPILARPPSAKRPLPKPTNTTELS